MNPKVPDPEEPPAELKAGGGFRVQAKPELRNEVKLCLERLG